MPSRDIPAYIRLFPRGRLPVDSLLSAELSPGEASYGFDLLREGKLLRGLISSMQ